MREKRKWVFAGIIGITILTGISALKEFTKIEDVYQAKFAFIAPKKWGKIARGVRKADEDFNTNTKCILYTQDTENSQADALQYALLSGVDGIITGGMEKSEKTLKSPKITEFQSFFRVKTLCALLYYIGYISSLN